MTERFLIEEAVNAIEMFIAIGFLTRYLGCKYNGKKAIGAFLLGWLTAFITLSIINQITVFESVGTYLYILVYLCTSFLERQCITQVMDVDPYASHYYNCCRNDYCQYRVSF